MSSKSVKFSPSSISLSFAELLYSLSISLSISSIMSFIALCRHLVVILSFISSTSVNVHTLSRCSFRHRHLSISLFPCQIHWKGRRLQAAFISRHWSSVVLLCNESFYRLRHHRCHPSRRPSRLLSCPHLIMYLAVHLVLYCVVTLSSIASRRYLVVYLINVCQCSYVISLFLPSSTFVNLTVPLPNPLEGETSTSRVH